MAPRYALSDSDSEAGNERSLPSTAKMEKALRDAVAEVFRSRNMDQLTVKRMRLAAEKALGLEEGFFKHDAEWKGESEQIIKDEVETQDRAAEREREDEEYQEENHDESHEEIQENSPPPPRSSPAKAKPAKPTKRGNEEDASKARKRRKTTSPESESAHESEEEVRKPVKKQPKAKSGKKEQRIPSEDRVSDEPGSEDEVKKPGKSKAKPKAAKPGDDSDAAKDESKPSEDANADKDGSESEMSEVFDEEPPKPKPKQQKTSEAQPGKAKKKGKDADLDPDQAEIKRLQGWLIKCGIRKMWARELAPYDTPKAKIKHLKQMLSDAGMAGRYSLEKAKRIREERELQADLEMVQEGAKLWGRGDEEEANDGERPRRKLARGRKSLAFLENEGEEESE